MNLRLKFQEIAKKEHFSTYVLLSASILLLIINVVIACVLINKFKGVKEGAKEEYTEVVVPKEEAQNNEAEQTPDTTTIKLAKNEIYVEWNDTLYKENNYTFFDYQTLADKISNDPSFVNPETGKMDVGAVENFMRAFDIYKAGKISAGQYVGDDLYVVTFRLEGPAFRDNIFRVIKDGNNLIKITKQSDDDGGIYEIAFNANTDISINNLEPQETINIPNSNIVLKRNKTEPYYLMMNLDNPKKIFAYKGTDYVYKDESRNCFVVMAADQTIRDYYFDLPWAVPSKEKEQWMTYTPMVLDFTLLDGTKNNNEYVLQNVTGCGAQGCYKYVDYITNVSQLEKIGSANSGDPIYSLTDKTLKANPADEKSILELAYEYYYPGFDPATQELQAKESYEEFLATNPLIYWQDPFGGFIEFTNAKYMPAVECGKPVIYLYPEKDTDVSVQVAPAGGFSVTEPVYNNGWFVNAKPSGELYNYADNTTYPYLFWEGFGLNYSRPEKGFVVAKADVEKFLAEKLSAMGLIEKEYNEFIEFWLPKMQDKNYYFITFVPQAQFDKLAPLNIEPKPDTVIRVFMDYEGLDNYVSVQPQTIYPVERKGFTVVEWGGAVHK